MLTLVSSRRPTPENLAEQLREIADALRRRVRAELEKTASAETLPYPQVSVLKRLDADGPASTADLARAEAMTPQSMGQTVSALETGGYVTRCDDSNHGRRRLVSVTAFGRKALAANRAARMRWTANLIAEQFDADEQRTLAAAFALLRRAFLPNERPHP
jgi:DNA-binding MarR family transcriptional regulator